MSVKSDIFAYREKPKCPEFVPARKTALDNFKICVQYPVRI